MELELAFEQSCSSSDNDEAETLAFLVEAAMEQVTTGRCLCGAVRFTLAGGLRDVSLCHCGQCRRWHGHVGASTTAPRAALAFQEQRGLAWFRSSNFARRGFCRECGSSLFWQRDGADLVSVTAGALDPPTGLATTLQIFTEDRGDYYVLDPSIAIRPKAGG